MQFAIMMFGKDDNQKSVLFDANELLAFNFAMESNDPANCLKEIVPDDDYEKSLQTRIVYGCYKPQSGCEFPRSEVIRQVKDGVGKWLVHINGLEVVYLAIEDIEVHEELILRKGCGHTNSKKPCPTDDIGFSALIVCPKNMDIGTKKTQAKSAFLRYRQQMDVMTNLLNRMGCFAFKAEEKRYKKVPTEKNWRSMIDRKRAVSAVLATI